MKRLMAVGVAGAVALAAQAGWQPGLREVAFASGNEIDKTSYAGAETNVVLRPERAFSAGARTTYTTYVYWGQIYLDGRTWNFAESFNRSVWLKIDGTVVLDDEAYNKTTAGSITRAPGWYDFELRLYCYNSAAGPVTSDNWGTTAYGFGRNASGYTGKASSYYSCPADPGDGTLFRCDDGNGIADVLDVASIPDVSFPGVAASTRSGLAAGAELTLSVPAVWRNETATMEATCTGWTLHDATGAEVDSGAGNTANYEHPSPAAYRKLVWHWTLSDPTGDANRRYVRFSYGNDANNGLTWNTAFATIQAAIAACPAGGSVVVGPGTYLAQNTTVTADSVVHALYIDKTIAILAAEGPDRTVVDAGTDVARAEAKVCAADALLAGFSFVNGANNAKARATGVEATAGTVSNCVVSIRAQWARAGAAFSLSGTARGHALQVAPASWNASESSSVVYLSDSAALDGLVITNFTYRNANGTASGTGYFVYLASTASLRNALVAGNTAGSIPTTSLRPLVHLANQNCRLADSTIANNTLLTGDGALQIAGNKATVSNVIVWANSNLSGTNPDIHGGANTNRLFHSCWPGAAAGTAALNTPLDPQFHDGASGDWRLRALSPAAEMGAEWLRPGGADAAFECAADADAHVSASGSPLAATFTGYCTEGHEVARAIWDFGDGTVVTGGWPTATHTYSVPGSYTATVVVEDTAGNAATNVLAAPFVALPLTCYVREGASGVYPYDSWEKATGSIADAVAVGSCNVVVTNGSYEIAPPFLGIYRPLSLTSVEGPAATTLVSTGGTDVDHRVLTAATASDILVAGFTLSGGYALNYGWSASLQMDTGMLSNCVVRGAGRISRSAVAVFSGTAKAVDCVFDGHGLTWNNNSSTQRGVSIEGSAVLDRCEIKSFRVDTANGNYPGEAPVCIASAGAVLRNSLVHHCTNGVSANAQYHGVVAMTGTGRIENCTVSDNLCGGYGGGVWANAGGTVANCVVYGNRALTAGDDMYSTVDTAVATNTLASDFSSWMRGVGSDCVAKNPNFDEGTPYHLTALSTACIDKGLALDWLDGALDLDRQPRVSGEAVDLGCYEFSGSTDVPLDGTLSLNAYLGRAPMEVSVEADLVGNVDGLSIAWNFGDGETAIGAAAATNHTYTAPGVYTVTAAVSNGAGETAALAPAVLTVVGDVCHVSPDGAHIPPFTTWADAATNIADAVALNPRTVLVTNGTYAISESIVLATDTALRSVNGAEATVIDAQSLCRNLWMTGQDALCEGFTLKRGVGNYGTMSIYARVEGGLLSRCILTNSVTTYRDTAVLVRNGGRMVDCVVDTGEATGNADFEYIYETVVQDGGVIDRCVIQRYRYSPGNLPNSSTTPHAAVKVEGGGVLRNCLVRDCRATHPSSTDTAYRSAILVSGSGTVENCTVVDCSGSQAGAGLTISAPASATPVIRNNIVWGNTALDGSENADIRDVASPSAPRVTYSCSSDLTTGQGNTTADPRFAGAVRAKPPYSLKSRSPLLNAGTYLDWMDGATDLIGLPRVSGTAPAMGCYESPYAGGTAMEVR